MTRSARNPLTLVALVLALGSTACGLVDAVDGGRERRIASIEWSGMPLHVEVPDAVEVDEAVSLVLHTYGGGCSEKGDTQVELRGLLARVTPHDLYRTGNVVCDGILKTHRHSATLRFDRVGTASVLIVGRDGGGELVVVKRSVEVR